MLFRYSFPMPRHGEVKPVTQYVDSDHNPRKSELLRMFETELAEATNEAEGKPEEHPAWHRIQEINACIYALKHIRKPDMPMLPQSDGSLMAAVYCGTEGQANIIRISLIEPLQLAQSQFRLVKEG